MFTTGSALLLTMFTCLLSQWIDNRGLNLVLIIGVIWIVIVGIFLTHWCILRVYDLVCLIRYILRLFIK